MIKVAIVEDTAIIRESLVSLFSLSEGFEFLAAFVDAESAIEQIPLIKPDVVLMDIGLPGINGVEAVRHLKGICPEIQFVMSTIFDDDEHIFEAMKAGATGYILKKTQAVKILEAIVEIHNGGAPMSGSIARKVMQMMIHGQPNKKEVESELLSQRENEILSLLANGFRYKEIAEKLFISIATVRTHVHKIYEKLQVSSRMEAINKVSPRRS
jgi:DNA-binding NarL/FixJ family response regulator